jgi:hypothetical protein
MMPNTKIEGPYPAPDEDLLIGTEETNIIQL